MVGQVQAGKEVSARCGEHVLDLEDVFSGEEKATNQHRQEWGEKTRRGVPTYHRESPFSPKSAMGLSSRPATNSRGDAPVRPVTRASKQRGYCAAGVPVAAGACAPKA